MKHIISLAVVCLLCISFKSYAVELPKRTNERSFTVKLIDKESKEKLTSFTNKIKVECIDKATEETIAGNGVDKNGTVELIIRQRFAKGPWLLIVKPSAEAPFAGQTIITSEDLQDGMVAMPINKIDVHHDVIFLLVNDNNCPMAHHFCSIAGDKMQTDKNGLLTKDVLADEKDLQVKVYRDGGDPCVLRVKQTDMADGLVVLRASRRSVSCIIGLQNNDSEGAPFQVSIKPRRDEDNDVIWQHSNNGIFVLYDLPDGEYEIINVMNLESGEKSEVLTEKSAAVFAVDKSEGISYIKVVKNGAEGD